MPQQPPHPLELLAAGLPRYVDEVKRFKALDAPVAPGSLDIFVNGLLLASDVGNGMLIDGANELQAEVDYSTGVVLMDELLDNHDHNDAFMFRWDD